MDMMMMMMMHLFTLHWSI